MNIFDLDPKMIFNRFVRFASTDNSASEWEVSGWRGKDLEYRRIIHQPICNGDCEWTDEFATEDEFIAWMLA